MITKGNTRQPSSTVNTSDAVELGFDPTLIEQNLSLSFSDRIKQASQAANAYAQAPSRRPQSTWLILSSC